MKHSYSSALINWGRVLLGACLVGLLLATQLHAQTTLSTGDLVFVGYNGSDDQGFTGNGQAITPGSNVNDKFAFVLLKDVAANTRIYFTDYGWMGGGFQPAWQAGSANNGSGTGSKDDGILSWTASASVAAGTQIVIRCKYSIGVNIGTVAAVENVSGQTYPLNLSDADTDQLFAYQATSARATPTLLAGFMYGDAWSASLTSTEYTPAKSTLPTSAVAGGGTAFLNLPSTSSIFNTFALGIYNCSTTVGFPRALRNAVNSMSTWKEYLGPDGTIGFLYNQDPDFLTHVPAGWDVPLSCTFTVLQLTITSQPVSKTVCSYQPATFSIAAQNAQTYKWQISSDGVTNWTDLSNGTVYSGVTTTTLTVTNPTGLTGKYYRAVAMEPVEPTAVPSNAAQLTVNNPPQTLALASSGPITCVVPAVRLTASSTTPGVTYAFSGPGGSITTPPGTTTISAGQPGIYFVIATTLQSCTATTPVTVVNDITPPTGVSLTVSSPLTCTATSVTLTAAASATSTINYTFAGPQGVVTATSNKAVVSLAGTYTVTATASANGCSTTAITTVTSNTTTPTATLTNNGPISCLVPSVTLTAGTDAGAQFVFSAGATQIGGNGSPTATVTTAGAYSVVITGTNGCTNTASTTVTGASTPISVSLTASSPISCTAPTVTLTATSINGATYLFSAGANQQGGPTGNTATVTESGTYTVTVSTANSCTTSTIVTVTGNNTPISVSLTASSPISCTAPTVTLTATSISGARYVFSSGATQQGGSTGNTATISAGGLYSVVVTNTNGCTATATTTVSSDTAVPTSVSLTSGTLTCAQTSLTLTASSVGGVSYTFSGGTPLGSNQLVVNSPGTYSVVVTGTSGCTAVASATVGQNVAVPTAVSLTSGTLTCAQTSLTLTASSVGGVNYAFSGGTPLSGNQIVVTQAGTYSVIVTGANGCTASASTSVGGNASVPTAVSLTGGTISCTQPSLTLTASSIGGVSYAFSGGTALGSNQVVVTQAGTYSVVVTGANGCTASASATVNSDASVPTSVSLTGGTISCAQPSVTLTASSVGGVTYTFSGGTPLGGNQVVVTSAGTYSVVVTGTNGCTASASTTVASDLTPPTPSLIASGTLTCAQTSVTLTAGTGITYAFTGPGLSQNGAANTAVVTQAGAYSVTVTGANGCSAIAATTVVSNTGTPTASLMASGTLTCANVSVTLTASQGVTYAFSGSGLTQSGPGNIAIVSQAGIYSVIVTGANGCTASASTTVVSDLTVPTASLVVSGSITCLQTSVTLTAGGNGTYTLTGPAGPVAISGNTALVSQAGTYTLTVTAISSGCQSITTVQVVGDQTVPAPSTPITSPQNFKACLNGPTVVLTANCATGIYRWSNGATTASISQVATTVGTFPYSVSCVTANGCLSAGVSATAVINPALLINTVTASPAVVCSGASTTLSVSTTGGTVPFTYSWTAAPGSDALTGPTQPMPVVATVTQNSTYSVVISDAGSCTAMGMVSITVKPVPMAPTLLTSASSTRPNQSVPGGQSSATVNVGDPVVSVETGNCAGVVSWSATSGSSGTGNFTIPTTSPGSVTYTATCIVNGCVSVPSAPFVLTVSGAPVGLQLIQPLYNCTTGALTFRTVGGNGSGTPVEYRAIGVTDWTTNPNQVVDLPVRQDANAQPLLLQARQGGVVVTYTFDFRLFCNSTVPNQPPVFTQPPAQTATVNQAFAYRIPDNTFRDLNGTAVNFMATNLPAGLSYASDTRIISGIPTAVGSYSVTLSVSDPLSLSASGVLVIQVNPVAQPPVSTTVNQAPVFNGPLAAQSGTVGSGFTYTLPVGIFTDPNAGDVLAYSASGLPTGLSFNATNRTISGVPTTAGVSAVTLTATDGGGLSASGLLTVTISASATPPVGAQPLAVIQPQYDCTTGAITFRTTGGDGSPIYFTSVGIVGYSTQTSYVLEAAIRNDANSQPLLIKATQNGVTTSYLFDFRLYCNGTVVTNPPVFAGPLPVQQGTVGVSFSYQLPPNSFTALNGGTLNYGITGLPAGLSFTAGSNLISGLPTQAGSFTATITATDPLNQSGQGPLVFVIAPAAQPPVGGQPLSLIAPLYNCQTGSFTFQTSGGDGSPIEYFAVGITGFTTVAGPYTVRPAGDAQPFTLKARQSGVEVTYTWDFKATCSGNTRVGVAESTSPLVVQVLGNPMTGGQLEVRVSGAQGQPLHYELLDVSGQLVSERQVESAGVVDQQQLSVDNRRSGLLLLRVNTPTHSQTVKVLKP